MNPLIYRKADYQGYAVLFGYVAVVILTGTLVKI